MRLENHPDYIVNPEDISSHFWKNNYLVRVSSQGISFLVNANNEQDALDYVMDFIVDNGFVGLYSEEYEEDSEYITAGNYGYSFTTYNIFIEKL